MEFSLPQITPFKGIKAEMPQVEILDNGAKILVSRYPGCEVLYVGLIFGGGMITQKKPLQCLTTLRMLPQGTKTLSSEEIAEQLDFRGSQITTTSLNFSSAISGTAVSRHAIHLITLLEKIVKEASFPQKEFNLLAKKTCENLRLALTMGNVLASNKLDSMLWGENHPLGHDVTIEDVENLSLDDVKQFYHDHFNSDDVTIVLSGDISDEILSQIKQSFSGNWGGKSVAEATIPCVSSSEPKTEIIDRPHLVQSSIMGALMMPLRTNPDYQALRCLVKLLGGYYGSRLNMNIREEKGYTYGITAELLGHRQIAFMNISTECNIEYTHKVIEEIKKEIDGFITRPVTEAETDLLRNNMLKRLAATIENPFSFGKYLLNMHDIKEAPDYINRQVDFINQITCNTLNRVARKYLSTDNLYFAIATNKKELKS